MRYHFANPEKLTRNMIHMVQKAYPEFDPERDFCLWLVFDLFDPAPATMLHGFFQISDREGNTLSLLPEKGTPMLRSPYPNKAITQIGMKAGRKRVYGVPVVVPDYDTLQSIHSLTLEWILLHPDDIQPSAAFCHSGYQFSWPEEPVNQMHWFTLTRKDTLKLDPDWYDIGYEGSRFWYEDGTVTVTDGTYTSFGLASRIIFPAGKPCPDQKQKGPISPGKKKCSLHSSLLILLIPVPSILPQQRVICPFPSPHPLFRSFPVMIK